MTSVTVTNDGVSLSVSAPYDPSFPPGAKRLGGKWSTARKVWTFDPRDEQAVRELVCEVYGTDGSADDDAPTLTVRLPLDDISRYHTARYRVAGRLIVMRQGRDAAVQYGDGVVLIAGGFARSGGSLASPDLACEPGTVVEVRDVPQGAARLMLDEVPGATIVQAPDGERARLEAERAALVERLAVIDGLLARL